MSHIIIKVVDINAAKEVKFEGDDANKIAACPKVQVQITPVGYQQGRALVVVICPE